MSKTFETVQNLLNDRLNKLAQLELANQIKNVRANMRAFDTKCAAVLAQHKVDFAYIANAPGKAQREDADSTIIADKTLTKWRQIVQALAYKDASFIDPYTRAIVRNMLALGSITNKECFATISNDANNEEGELRAIKVRLGKAGTTAGAQAPTTRHALHKLGICVYDANKRVMTLADTKIAQEFKALFE